MQRSKTRIGLCLLAALCACAPDDAESHTDMLSTDQEKAEDEREEESEQTQKESDGDSDSDSDRDSEQDSERDSDPDDDSSTEPSEGDPDPGLEFENGACIVDADCGPGFSCILGICATGCEEDNECDTGQICDPHGTCVDAASKQKQLRTQAQGSISLSEQETALSTDDDSALVTITNDGDETLAYRVESHDDAIDHEIDPIELEPGENAEIEVDFDPQALDPQQQVVPITIRTEEGTHAWFLRREVEPELDGHYRASVVFGDPETTLLGTTTLSLNLDFQSTGTVEGHTLANDSLMWPNDATVSGTWDETSGDFTLRIVDVVAESLADDPLIQNPLLRAVGRELILEGIVNTDKQSIHGTLVEELTGLHDTAIRIDGSFGMYRDGPIVEHSTDAQSYAAQLPVPLPDWQFPTDLSTNGICVGLTADYGKTSSCMECADLTCEASELYVCAKILVDRGYNIEGGVLPPSTDGNDVAVPDPMDWAKCMDPDPVYENGRTCLDRKAITCARLMATVAVQEGDFTSALHRDALTRKAFHAEASAASLLATNLMVEAAFAYQSVTGTHIIEHELTLLEEAEALLLPVLQVAASPGYTKAVELNREWFEVYGETGAITLPSTLAEKWSEIVAMRLRLLQRTKPNQRAQLKDAAAHAAVWIHLYAALWQEVAVFMGYAERLEELNGVRQALSRIEQIHQRLGDGRNAFGFSESYVPMLLTAKKADMEITNFELNEQVAQEQLQTYAIIEIEAEEANDRLQNESFRISEEKAAIEDSYDAQLVALCGSEPGDPATPDLARCGTNAGAIKTQQARIAAAGSRVNVAEAALAASRDRMNVEQCRLAQVMQNREELRVILDDLENIRTDEIIRIQDTTGTAVAATATLEADAQCNDIRGRASDAETSMAATAVTQMASAATKAAAGAAVSFGASVAVGAAEIVAVTVECAAKATELLSNAKRDCDAARRQAGVQNGIAGIQLRGEQDIMLVNADIDQQIAKAASQADIQEEIINSEAVVLNILHEIQPLQKEIDAAHADVEVASAELRAMLSEVMSLLDRKFNALRRIENDPNNPAASPRFLFARLDRGRHLLRWREIALKEAYLAARALEYDINQDVPLIESELLTARASSEVTAFLSCLNGIDTDYHRAFGSPQEHVDELSLGENIFRLPTEVQDHVTGDIATRGDQFRAMLLAPDNLNADGTITLGFALPLRGDTPWSASLCDDRIESIEVKLVGDYLGDNEAEVVIEREGLNRVRRCDAQDVFTEDAFVDYAFDLRKTAVQAGINDYGLASPDGGFAGWPVGGAKWRIVIPPGHVAPQNADLDVTEIHDIILKITHIARTVSADTSFAPVCG